MSSLPVRFLDDLKLAAEEAGSAEQSFRREAGERIAKLERERAFAFRRLNLMRSIAERITTAESGELAIASGLEALSDMLGWTGESETRTAILAKFEPVIEAAHRSIVSSDGAESCDLAAVLAEFETWYAETYGTPFWLLFDHEMPETPRVDF